MKAFQMGRAAWPAALLLAAGLASGCQKAPEPPPRAEASAERAWRAEDPVLRFGNEVVTYGQMRDEWALSGRGGSFDAAGPRERRQFLRDWATNHLLAREARAQGLDQTPEYRSRVLPWLYARLGPVFVQKEITEKVTPSDEELMQYLPLALPEVQVRVIVRHDKAEADEIYRRVTEGRENFEAVARAESQGRLGYKGGLTHWLTVMDFTMFPPPVTERFLAAEVGHVFEPFYHDLGFLVVRVEGKHTAEQVRKMALASRRDRLLLHRQREAYEARLEELERHTPVVVHDPVLDQVLAGRADPNAVLLEVGGVRFAAGEVAGQAVSVPLHGPQPLAQRINSFLKVALVGQEAMRLGLHELPEVRADLARAEERLLARALIEAVGLEEDARELTLDDLRAYFSARPEDLFQPEERRLELIQADTEADAAAALARVRGGVAFADVAREVSTHAESTARGGDIGFFPGQALPVPVRDAVWDLPEGAYTPSPVVVQTPDGPRWLLLRVVAVREAAQADPESAKSPIVEGRIRTAKRTQAFSQLLRGLEEKHGYRNCYEDPC